MKKQPLIVLGLSLLLSLAVACQSSTKNVQPSANPTATSSEETSTLKTQDQIPEAESLKRELIEVFKRARLYYFQRTDIGERLKTWPFREPLAQELRLYSIDGQDVYALLLHFEYAKNKTQTEWTFYRKDQSRGFQLNKLMINDLPVPALYAAGEAQSKPEPKKLTVLRDREVDGQILDQPKEVTYEIELEDRYTLKLLDSASRSLQEKKLQEQLKWGKETLQPENLHDHYDRIHAQLAALSADTDAMRAYKATWPFSGWMGAISYYSMIPSPIEGIETVYEMKLLDLLEYLNHYNEIQVEEMDIFAFLQPEFLSENRYMEVTSEELKSKATEIRAFLETRPNSILYVCDEDRFLYSQFPGAGGAYRAPEIAAKEEWTYDGNRIEIANYDVNEENGAKSLAYTLCLKANQKSYPYKENKSPYYVEKVLEAPQTKEP